MATSFFNDDSHISMQQPSQPQSCKQESARIQNENASWLYGIHQPKENGQKHEQLINIAKKIYSRNCLFSLFCIFSLVCGILAVHWYIDKLIVTQKIQNNKHGNLQLGLLCNSMKQDIQQTINYFKYIQKMVTNIQTKYYSDQLYIPPTQNLQKYTNTIGSMADYQQIHRQNQYGKRGGLQCLTYYARLQTDNNSTISPCNIFLPISKIIWQYIQHPSISKITSQIIICSNISEQSIKNQQYYCVGTPLTNKSDYQQHLGLLVKQAYKYLSDSSNRNYPKIFRETVNNKMYIGLFQQINLTGIYTNTASLILMKISFDPSTISSLIDLHSYMHSQSFLRIKIQINPKSAIIGDNFTIINSYQRQQNSTIIPVDANIVPNTVPISSSQYILGGYNQYKFIIAIRIQQYLQISEKVQAKLFLCLIPLLYIVYVYKIQIQSIRDKIVQLFSRKQLLNQLFKLSIQQIFIGKKAIHSSVLQKSQTGKILYKINQLIDKTVSPIISEVRQEKNKKSFQFVERTNTMLQRYKHIVNHLMHMKNKQILNNRFSIQSFINDICQAENKKIKDFHAKAQQLGLLQDFFKFAYTAIIMSPQKYRNFIKNDQKPVPRDLISQFIRMNNQLHEVDVLRERIQSGINGTYTFRNSNEQNGKDMKENGKKNQGASPQLARNKHMYSEQKSATNKQSERTKKVLSAGLQKRKQTEFPIKIVKKQINQLHPKKVRNRHKGQILNASQLPKFYVPQLAHRDKVGQDQSVGDAVIFSKTESQRIDEQEINQPSVEEIIEQQKQQLSPVNNYKGNDEGNEDNKNEQVFRFQQGRDNLQDNQLSNTSKYQSSCALDQKNWQQQETKQQLQIRIRVHMIPKYLAMLKDLDFQNQYAKKLQLQRQLWNLSQIIENTRYLIMKHNKNIRAFSK